MKNTSFLVCLLALTFLSCKPSPTLPGRPEQTLNAKKTAAEKPSLPATSPDKSLLRVNATQQTYNYLTPWEKTSPSSESALGAVMENGLVLVTADVVTDATYISFSTNDKSRTFPAEVVAVDYEANLALLQPMREEDKKVLEEMVPLTLSENLSRSAPIQFWQLEEEGTPLITEGNVQTFEMETPFIPGRLFLEYKVKGSLQNLGDSFTLPIISGGKLAGMLMSYDRGNQVSKVLDISVLRSFIQNAKDGDYTGFPYLGIKTEETTDPTFRKYLKLSDDMGGVYISKLNKSASAGLAGIKKGDVILSIDGQKIDSRGYYESPAYGKLEYTRLINGAHKAGDTASIRIMREGQEQDVPVKLMASQEVKQLIPPYLYGKEPPYVLYGGMVFVELSLPYIQSFGNSWANRLSGGLVSAILDPSVYEEKGLQRIVVTSGCIPTPATLGYGSLAGHVVEKVNGKPVKNLKDLATYLDENKEDIQTVSFIGAPYDIYLSRKKVEETEPALKKQFTPELRKLD